MAFLNSLFNVRKIFPNEKFTMNNGQYFASHCQLLFNKLNNDHRIVDGIDGRGGEIFIESRGKPFNCKANIPGKHIVIRSVLKQTEKIFGWFIVELL